MAKTLELLFLNEEGKTVKVNVDSPIDPVDQLAISTAMDQIITANVFISNGGNLIAKEGARIVDRNVTEISLA